MAGEYILGQNNNNEDKPNSSIIKQINDVGQQEIVTDITPEDIMNMMKHKAMCFDILFYITSRNDKTGKIEPPKNKTEFPQDEYEAIWTVCKAMLELEDIKTKELYIKNMKSYLPGLAKRTKKP